MARIAIVEDDAAAAEKLRGYVKRYMAETGTELELTSFPDGEALVNSYRPVYDVIFLDIQMPRMDGITAAEHIREQDKDVLLVFITNMAQYAIRGYAVDALDFLLKPVTYFAFAQEIERCLRRMTTRKRQYLILPTDNGVVRMDVARIEYVESLRHHITVYTQDGEFSITSTMKELEAKLVPLHFFRCNSGCLVNLACVTGVQDSCAHMTGGAVLPVSRARRKAFLDALTDYVGGVR